MRLPWPFLLLFLVQVVVGGKQGCWTTKGGKAIQGSRLIDFFAGGTPPSELKYWPGLTDHGCTYTFQFPSGCRKSDEADDIEFSATMHRQYTGGSQNEFGCDWIDDETMSCEMKPTDDERILTKLVTFIGLFKIGKGGTSRYEQSTCVLLLLDDIRNSVGNHPGCMDGDSDRLNDNLTRKGGQVKGCPPLEQAYMGLCKDQNHPGCTEGDSDRLSLYVTGKNGRVEGCPPLEKAFQDSCGHVDSKLVGNIDCDILPQYDPVNKVVVPYGESEIVDVDPTDPPEIEEEVITAKPRDEDIKDPEEVFTAEPREELPPPNVAVFTAKPQTEDPTDEEEEEPEIVDPTEAPVEQEDPEEPTEAPDDDEGKDEPIGRPPATIKPGNGGDGSNSLNSENTGSNSEDGKSSSEEDFPTWAIVVIALVGVVLIAVPIIAFVVYKKKSQKEKKKKKKGKNGETERTDMEASVITITANKSKKSKKAKETKSKSKTKSRSRSTTASTAGTTARTPVSTTPGTTGTTGTTDLNSKSTAPGSTINLA